MDKKLIVSIFLLFWVCFFLLLCKKKDNNEQGTIIPTIIENPKYFSCFGFDGVKGNAYYISRLKKDFVIQFINLPEFLHLNLTYQVLVNELNERGEIIDSFSVDGTHEDLSDNMTLKLTKFIDTDAFRFDNKHY
jgi:hypothetical protein